MVTLRGMLRGGSATQPRVHRAQQAALRASITEFLGFPAGEPAFARAFYIDMPAAGARAVARIEAAQHRFARIEAAQHRFARLNRAWHERARRDHPDWPAVPYQAYYALAGATTELVRAEVRQGRIGTVSGLADTLVALHLAVLAARSWPGAESSGPAG